MLYAVGLQWVKGFAKKAASCCTRANYAANLHCNPQKQFTLWQLYCIQQGADKQTVPPRRQSGASWHGQQLGNVWLPSASHLRRVEARIDDMGERGA